MKKKKVIPDSDVQSVISFVDLSLLKTEEQYRKTIEQFARAFRKKESEIAELFATRLLAA